MKTLEELEQDLLVVTSRLTTLDKIMAQARLGVDMRMCFLCNHSGLYYPSDYVREYGRLYGIGLGPDPVSEALNSEYEIDPPEITPQTRRIEQIMHPIGNVKVQVDLHLVEAGEYSKGLAVLAKDDPFMERRAAIVYQKQLVNTKGRLHLVRAAWMKSRQSAGLVQVA